MSYAFKTRFIPRKFASALMQGAPRDLSRGSRVVAQGRVIDSAGRPTDATVSVYRGSTQVGVVRSVAGRFSIFDLAPSSYTFRATGARGGTSSGAFAINGSISNFTVRV